MDVLKKVAAKRNWLTSHVVAMLFVSICLRPDRAERRRPAARSA
jgi:hypothetical protein